MKKIIPLFAFTFCLHLSLFALSIRSDEIDAFMHLPDWFPTSVGSVHTFGSEDRATSNATRRTTINTLAAVESVFEGYHERVLYASEGRSNDWDVAVYGPRPTDLQRLWFTNAASAEASCFVYQSWTNTWPRATPESRRLLEFDNVFALAKWMPSLFSRRLGAPWLDKGYTWGQCRDIMFGSSWGPVDTELPDVAWTENAEFRPDLASSCVPLCYCLPDKSFNRASPSEDGFLWDVLKDLDSNFNALYRIEGGPLPHPVATNGYLAELHLAGSYRTNAIGRISIPDVITNKFQTAGPEAGLTNITRRLVPDDYFQAGVVTSYWKVVDSYNVSIDFRPYRPDGTEGRGSATPVYVFDRASVGFEEDTGYIVHAEAANHEYVDYIGWDGYISLRPPRDGEVVHFSYRSYPSGRYVSDGYFSSVWLWRSSELAVTADYKKFVFETNGAFSCSSILATDSRALAMLDRTYEIPTRVVPASIPMTEYARDTRRNFRSSLKSENDIVIDVINLEFPFTPIPGGYISLSDILHGKRPEIEYTTTNIYSSIAHPTVIERRLTGGGGIAEGKISCFSPEESFMSDYYTVRHLKRILADMFGTTEKLRGTYEVRRVSGWADEITGVGGVDFTYKSPSDPYPAYENVGSDYLYICSASEMINTNVLHITVGGSLEIERSASVFIGGVPPLYVFDRMYPWYGPGPFGFSNRKVESSSVLFAEEIMALYANPPSDYYTKEWSDSDPAALPPQRTYQELQDPTYEWNSWHRISSRDFGGVWSGPAAQIYNETYNTLNQKVNEVFRSYVGNFGSAEDVIPVSIDMASDISLFGFDVSLRPGEDYTNALVCVISGGRESDVTVSLKGGDSILPDETHLVGFKIIVSGEQSGSGDSFFRNEYRRRPAAVDGRLSPVIVTDWNWKALKTYENP